jgi:hypothetical protein
MKELSVWIENKPLEEAFKSIHSVIEKIAENEKTHEEFSELNEKIKKEINFIHEKMRVVNSDQKVEDQLFNL